MSFRVKVDDWHIRARYWQPVFYVARDSGIKVIRPPRLLGTYEDWLCPVDAGQGLTCDFRCMLFKKDETILDWKDKDNILVKNGAEYEYNWANNTFRQIEAPPPPVGKFTLTTSCTPAVGYITKQPDKDLYESYEKVKLTAFVFIDLRAQYEFESWYLDDEWLDTANPITFVVTASHHLTARFREIEAPPVPPPPPPPPIGVIEKPAEVRAWLAELNWTVLGVYIPVGDTVEYAIDLIIGFINNVLGIAQEARNIAEGLKGSILEAINIFFTVAGKLRADLTNLDISIPGRITSWWEGKKPIVQGWIDIAVMGLDKLKADWDYFWDVTFPYWTSQLEAIAELWNDFKKYTLPTLINVSWITDWWSGKAQDIDQWIKSAFVERDSLWAGWVELKDTVTDFFADPLEWLWERFADWFLGKE